MPTDPSIDPWDILKDELDLWQSQGRVASFWWRDDDAVRPGPKLERLLRTAGDVPLSLAVIPEDVDPDLAALLAAYPQASVLQHGYSHRNLAPETEKKSEFPASRDMANALIDLTVGKDTLMALFGDRFRPVLVPPWNRIGDPLPSNLHAIGLKGLSTYRRKTRKDIGIRCIDTHCDIVAWRTTRAFIGDEHALVAVTEHLQARRSASVFEEPTGMMSHHIVHDEGCWSFLARFVETVNDHPAAVWCDPFRDLCIS